MLNRSIIKLALLLTANLVLNLNLVGQNTHRFSGIILDESTKAPIAWAHLRINESGNGTVSNAEGRFSINLQIGSPNTVTISCVGYKSVSTNFTSSEFSDLKIFLVPEIKLLSEIEVRPTDVRQMIFEAIKKIPSNYPAKPTLLTGFYRESLRYDSIHYIYLSEGILQARKESYQQIEQSGQVKLLKSRKKEFLDSLNTLNKIRFYGGAHSVHTGDFVISRKEFINEKTINDYEYTINEVTHLNGAEVYKILFKPIKPTGLFYGELYLDAKSSSFLSARYKLTQTGIKKLKEPFNIFSRPVSAERLIHFMNTGNGWMIQDTWAESHWYDKRLNDTLIFQSEFVTTDIDTENVNSFQYSDKIQYRDIFINKATNLDPSFWDGYTILKENSFIERIQNKELNTMSTSTNYSQESSSSQTRKNNKRGFIRFMEKTTFDIAIANLFPNYSISNVSLVGNGFAVNSSISRPNQIVSAFYTALNIDLRKRLSLQLGFITSFEKLSFENARLGLGYGWQTAIRTRPLKFTGSLGFSYNSLYLPIGTVRGPLNINGNVLSDIVDVNLQREFFAFQPSLKIALELNRRWDFFVSANYLFDLGIEHKILFEEQAGFFSKNRASISTINPIINFKIDGNKAEIVPVSISSFFLNTGFTYKYAR